jgi:hypothetical protein
LIVLVVFGKKKLVGSNMKKMLNKVGTGDDLSFPISRLSVCRVSNNPYTMVSELKILKIFFGH